MNAVRRSPMRGLYGAACLLTAFAVIFSVRPVGAAPAGDPSHDAPRSAAAAPSPDPALTRFEGQVQSIAGDVWQVNDFTVALSADTALLEQRGAAQVGAWVQVSGTRYDNFVAAEVVEILRAAGQPAPTYQYTGPLGKQGGTFWFVGDTHVLVTPATVLTGNLTPGNLVRATVRRVGDEWEALAVEALAADPARTPLAIEGVVEQVADGSWIVDGHMIVPPQQALTLQPGDTVEVVVVDEGGTLVAQSARRVNPVDQTQLSGYISQVAGQGEDNQSWTLLVFEGDQIRTQTIRVTPQTYVDEDRATVETGLEAHVQGERTGEATVDADLIQLDQPAPALAAGALIAGQADEAWLVGGQPVWFGSEQIKAEAISAAGLSQAAAGTPGAGAGITVRGVRLSNGIVVAKDVSPAASAGASAQPGAAPSASVQGAEWHGPNYINTSASGASKPTVLFDDAGGGHAIYESLGNIYYSYQPPHAAWGAPRKIGVGVTPSAALDSDGLLHVAFRGEFLKNYDIMHVRQLPSGAWTLPVVIAPTTGASADPSLVTDAAGRAYVAWMDLTSGSWAVQLGAWDGRYWTTYPVYYGQGQSPALAVLPAGGLFIAWQDRIPTPENPAGDFEVFAAERPNQDQFSTLPAVVSDNLAWRPGANSIGVRVTTTPDGFVHLAWVDDNVQVRYLFGRAGYWPIPYDVGPRRDLVRGIGLQAATDGLLYLAIDGGETVSAVAVPPRTQTWPEAQVIATRSAPTGLVSDVSLTSSADRVVVTWVQANGVDSATILESQRQTVQQMLRFYAPMIAIQ